MAIDWDTIYEEELAKIDDPTDDIGNLKTADIKALDDQTAASKQELKTTLVDALRQAYVAKEMNKKDLPALMSNLGLTGGVTETAASDLLRDYRNSRNSANTNYNKFLTDIDNTYTQGINSINSKYGQMLIDALAQRSRDAYSNTGTRFQNELAKAQWDLQQLQAAPPAAVTTSGDDGNDNPTAPPMPKPTWTETGGAQGQAYDNGTPGKDTPRARNSYKDPKTGEYKYF
jgi:hypothetical protein